VELLVDDGLGEGLEGGLGAGELEGEGAGASDEAGESGVGCGQGADRFRGVVGRAAVARGVRAGHVGR